MKNIPYISVDQMREVDRLMIEDYKISLLQMMENAGRNLASLARSHFLDGNVKEKSIVILAGSGGNGGGGIVCARHLFNWGAKIKLVTQKPVQKYTKVAALQLNILKNMNVPIINSDDFLLSQQSISPALIIDALIGYSLIRAPRGKAAQLINWANQSPSPILSLDVPSGLDSDTGYGNFPTIKASATMTLALPKVGLRTPTDDNLIGDLFLADISVPIQLYKEMGIKMDNESLFSQNAIIKI